MDAFMHTGPSPRPPAEPPRRDEIRERHLARLFAAEPELIQACLESLDDQATGEAWTILGAAEQALSDRPDYADLYYFAAQAAMQLHRPQHARELLDKALRINPDYKAALILAARACLLQDNQDAALEYLRQALVNGADYADVHLMLGDLWARRDNVGAAQKAYERALQINTRLAPARDGLAALANRRRRGGSDELPA